MSKAKDIAKLAGGGFFIGALLGLLSASGYATWQTGGDLAEIDPLRVFDFAPWERGFFGEPFRTALYIGLGITTALTALVPIIGFKKALTSHGTARWSTKAELKKAELLATTKTILGPVYGKMGMPNSRAEFLSTRPGPDEIPHSLITAPTGSGKGAGIVIPTLLTYKGSVFCLDVKGENYEATARRREAMGDRVYKFAPYDDRGQTHRYNPMMYVVAARERRRFTEARRLAASLIIAKGNGEGFLEGSRDVFAAGAMLAIQRGTPTIAAIYDAFYATPGEAADVFRRLAAEVETDEAKTIFNRMAGMESRILSSYLSVLSDGGLGLWADPAVRDATEVSDFGIHDLRRDPASIFIVVSVNDLVPLAPLIRLMFQQAVAVMQNSMPQKDEKFPVLFLLDEFPALGRMDVLATAITTLRGFGGRIMLVIQSLASLRDTYGKDGASVFLSNCRLQLFMAPNDEDTPEYISRAIGDFTRKSRSKSWRTNEFTTNWQEREEGSRLLRAEQVRSLSKDRIVVLVQGMQPVMAYKVKWFEDRFLKKIFRSQMGPYPEPPSLYNDPPPALDGPADLPDDPPPAPPAPAAMALDLPQERQPAPEPAPQPANSPDAPAVHDVRAPANTPQATSTEAVPATPVAEEKTPIENEISDATDVASEEEAEEPTVDHLRGVYRRQRYIKGDLHDFAAALASVHVDNMSRDGHDEGTTDQPPTDETAEPVRPAKSKRKPTANIIDLTAAITDVSKQNSTK